MGNWYLGKVLCIVVKIGLVLILRVKMNCEGVKIDYSEKCLEGGILLFFWLIVDFEYGVEELGVKEEFCC